MYNWMGKIASILGLTEKAVGKILDITSSLLESEVTHYKSLEAELDRLNRTCERITALLTDAEERRFIEEDEYVTRWFAELRSIYFESDDLLDEYQTALKVHKHNSFHVGSTRKRKYFDIAFPSLSPSPECGPVQRRKFSTAIDKINMRLGDINEATVALNLRGRYGTGRQILRTIQPSSCRGPAKIVCRVTEINRIIELLKSEPSETRQGTIPVVAIHGASGIGKTTLAQNVFDVDTYFDQKIWVWLSDECDAISTNKEIFKKITNQNCEFRSLDTIFNSIRDHFNQSEAKKILLAIDNLPTVDFLFWETLQDAIRASKKEVKILITTRSKIVCELMSALPHTLAGLDDPECWELLSSLALSPSINTESENLVPIGKEIVKKCGGSPMAAKVLGALLNGKDEEEWSNILSEMQVLKDDQIGLLPILKTSYHHLMYDVKLCFAHSSIFPKGHTFEKDKIIRYWMAEGLIRPDGRRRLEAVGSMYFDDLVRRSFFEKAPPCDESRVEKYKIPSLMHDLARLVARCDFVGLESDVSRDDFDISWDESNHMRARYGSLSHRANDGVIKIEKFYPYSNLRTLKSCAEYNDTLVPMRHIAPDLFRNLKCLRVLDLSNSLLKNLPDFVVELIHLRYLGLSNTPIQNLPKKLGDLFNLQTLELKGCLKLKELPQGMSKLVNLRHLDLHVEWEKIEDSSELVIPQGIDKLKSLQTLSRFNVPPCSIQGQSTINELKNLNLRGDLFLMNLENLSTSNDAALDANLRGKPFIENLMLRWSQYASTNHRQLQQSKEVLESLQPSNRIKCLWIVNYPGTTFPDWVGHPSFLSLETIRISNCNNFSFLPFLGQLSRLKNLHVENIGAKTMGTIPGFQSLKYMTLLNLPSLERLFLDNEIPKLKRVYISECPELQELLIHHGSYAKFERGTCPRLSKIVCENSVSKALS